MKLSVIFPVLNQHDLARAVIAVTKGAMSKDSDAEIVVLDNGSDVPFEMEGVRVIRSDKNLGVYPTFWWGLNEAKGDILAFFHSDFLVGGTDWDLDVIKAFEARPKLGLLGCIGSNEIDSAGGRGLGTASNFQGGTISDQHGESQKTWTGSPAEPHGRRLYDFMDAAVVDGCAMIFRREALAAIKQRPDFPPHHFYDRLLSCETAEAGYTIGVLGLACDHISGQTVNQEPSYAVMAQVWANEHGIEKGDAHNWDTVIYAEAERQWLKEYRDEKHFIPRKV